MAQNQVVAIHHFFGLGNNYKNWIKILLYNFKASINHAGNISLPFNILRGCKQGDPIASALFILSIEILCIKLCNSTNMEGFKIMHKRSFYHYTQIINTIFLLYCTRNVENTVNIFNGFYNTSGLKIHMTKTQCVVFGKLPPGNRRLCPELNQNWGIRNSNFYEQTLTLAKTYDLDKCDGKSHGKLAIQICNSTKKSTSSNNLTPIQIISSSFRSPVAQ